MRQADARNIVKKIEKEFGMYFVSLLRACFALVVAASMQPKICCDTVFRIGKALTRHSTL
jgi:hypothetical protein